MKKLLLIQYMIFLPILLFGQNEEVSLRMNEDVSDQLTSTELKDIYSSSEKMMDRYDLHGSLIDSEQYRITGNSMAAFKELFTGDANILIDFLSPLKEGSVKEYIKFARTYYEREGIPFALNDTRLINAQFREDCNCYQSTIQLNKTLQHYYSEGSWMYEDKSIKLEFQLQIDKETLDAQIISIRKAPKPTIPQRSQHTVSLMAGTSFINGSIPAGFEVTAPYSIGLSYQFIQPLTFLGNSISVIAGAQFKYSKVNTSVQEGTTLRIDENEEFNSVTDIEFLTAGEEVITSITVEPQIGVDIQFLEKMDRQFGVALLFTPRFSLSGSGSFTGALHYEETFNDRVSISNIINCGLRDFEGADAIDATYDTHLYNAGISFALSPYYQFETSNRKGFRIGIDIQYYLSSMYKEGGRFLGNYNDANNPDTNDNPELNANDASILQTVGGDLSELYVGIKLGYYFAHR